MSAVTRIIHTRISLAGSLSRSKLDSLRRIVLGACLVMLMAWCAEIRSHAAEHAVKAIEKPVPNTVAEPLRSLLRGQAVQLLEGGAPLFEFWWPQAVPLKSKPESDAQGLDTVRSRTFLGVVQVHKEQRDYKKGKIPPGLYTMRFEVQPQDGNHLGTAVFPYFVLLVPVERDQKVESFASYEELVKASSEGTPTEHPLVLNLVPPSSTEGPFPKLNEPAPEHRSIRLQLPAKAEGSSEAKLLFEVVYSGAGHS